MSLHLPLALLTLAVLAIVDLHIRRIPNKTLGLALILHVLIWILVDESGRFGFKPSIVFLIFIVSLLLLPSCRRVVEDTVGMGDIKLISYALFFMSPYLSLETWLLSISLISVIVTVILGFRGYPLRGRRIPFAPLFFLGTSIAFLA